jgi:hypothetical protein
MNNLFLQDYFCTPQFRNNILNSYPILKKNEGYLRLMQYIIYSNFKDKEHGGLIISQRIVGLCEHGNGFDVKDTNNHYSAIKFLKAFQKDTGITLQIANESKGIARRLYAHDIPEELISLSNELRSLTDGQPKVSFVSGKKKDKNNANELRKQALTTLNEDAHTEEAKRVLRYLNGLPSNQFNKSLDNASRAIEALIVLESDVRTRKSKGKSTINLLGKDDEEKLKTNVSAVIAHYHQPQPMYEPTENSDRLFTSSNGLLCMSSEFRDYFTAGWDKADLKSAQLAICAKEWNVPLVQEFIKTKESIWKSLFETMGYDYNLKDSHPKEFKALKSPFKTALYSLMFGMEIRNIKRSITIATGTKKAGDLFFTNPYINAMAEARSRHIDEINLAGGATNIFGRWIPIQDDNYNSILAQLAQATEFYIILSVYELAMETNDFDVIVHIHDGLSLNFVKNKDTWVKRINKAIRDKAIELQVETELEWEFVK